MDEGTQMKTQLLTAIGETGLQPEVGPVVERPGKALAAIAAWHTVAV